MKWRGHRQAEPWRQVGFPAHPSLTAAGDSANVLIAHTPLISIETRLTEAGKLQTSN
jgi:hypothetical protein